MNRELAELLPAVWLHVAVPSTPTDSDVPVALSAAVGPLRL